MVVDPAKAERIIAHIEVDGIPDGVGWNQFDVELPNGEKRRAQLRSIGTRTVIAVGLTPADLGSAKWAR